MTKPHITPVMEYDILKNNYDNAEAVLREKAIKAVSALLGDNDKYTFPKPVVYGQIVMTHIQREQGKVVLYATNCEPCFLDYATAVVLMALHTSIPVPTLKGTRDDALRQYKCPSCNTKSEDGDEGTFLYKSKDRDNSSGDGTGYSWDEVHQCKCGTVYTFENGC